MLVTPNCDSSMISLYRAMRRALFQLRDQPIVGVFLGMKSSLQDFVLNYKADASMREPVPQTAKLIPHYHLNDTFDVKLIEPVQVDHSLWVKERNVEKRKFLTATESHEEFVINCGRPLWSAYSQKGIPDVINLAISKLGVKTETEDLANLTALLIRIGAAINPRDPLNHKLVLSGMATLIYADSIGSSCYTQYYPEPVLSNAARLHLLKDVNFESAVKEFRQLLDLGAFRNSGDAGEFVGRLLLLRAFDKALVFERSEVVDREAINYLSILGFGTSTFYSPFIGVCTLKDFLISLTGFDLKDLALFGCSDAVMEGLVSINQFVNVEPGVKIDQLFLAHGFAKSCGFGLYHSAKSADIIIPVLRTDGCMSCVAVQIKNLKAGTAFPHKPSTINDKLKYNYLNFLSFDKCGTIPEVQDKDDFVKIVIQFTEVIKSEPITESTATYYWHPPGERANKRVLNLLGLGPLEHLLYVNDIEKGKDAANSLERVLSFDRNYFNGVEFQPSDTFSLRQTSRIGADTLALTTSPLSNNANLAVFDAQGRGIYSNLREEALKKFSDCKVAEEDFDFKKNFSVYLKPSPLKESLLGQISSPSSSGNEDEKSPFVSTPEAPQKMVTRKRRKEASYNVSSKKKVTF